MTAQQEQEKIEAEAKEICSRCGAEYYNILGASCCWKCLNAPSLTQSNNPSNNLK